MPWEYYSKSNITVGEEPESSKGGSDVYEHKDSNIIHIELLEKSSPPLSLLESILASTVISEAIQKVDILLAQLPRTDAIFSFQNANKKSNEPLRRSIYMTEEDCSLEVKISTELMKMKAVLWMTKDEFRNNENPVALHTYNNLTLRVNLSDEAIVKSHVKAKNLVNSFHANMELAEYMVNETLSGMDTRVANIEAGHEEACSLTTIMREYTEKYNKARIEQNTLKIKIAEKKHKKELYIKLKAIDDEHRANKLIVKYINQATENLERSIKYWSERYDRDIEEIDLKIAKADQEIPESVAELAKLLTTFYARELEMAEYVRLRNWRMKMEDIGRFLEFFAVVIQAWWRGMMVRWELGPFAPKKIKKR